MMSTSRYNRQYQHALNKIAKYGIKTIPRGLYCKEILNFSFCIDPTDNVINLKGWETNVEYAIIELQWYLAATNSIYYHPTILKTWKRFSDDNKTVNSAYGYRLFGNEPRINVNQWQWVINKFREDPDSRQCVININSAFDKEKPTKDFPCTIAIHAMIRNNKLYWTTYMRSQDLYYGTRNDVYCFTELQKIMAKELNTELGTYTHTCTSLHLYEKQLRKLDHE